MMPRFRILDTVFVPQVSYQSEIKFESHLNMGWSNKKKVLKTHGVNISLSLRKLRQYNKILRTRQTKINTAINTN